MANKDIQKQTISTCLGVLCAFAAMGVIFLLVMAFGFASCAKVVSNGVEKSRKESGSYDQVPQNLRSSNETPTPRLDALADALKADGFVWTDSSGPEKSENSDSVQSGALFGFKKTGPPVDVVLTQYYPGQGPFIGPRSYYSTSIVIRIGDFSVYYGKDKPSKEDAEALTQVFRSFQNQK